MTKESNWKVQDRKIGDTFPVLDPIYLFTGSGNASALNWICKDYINNWCDRKFSREENIELSISKLAYRRGH
jgi:hypothetical protein